MKVALPDIPPRPAILVIALVLLATVVTGREHEPAPQAAVQPTPRVELPPPPDFTLPARTRSEREASDLFRTTGEPTTVPVQTAPIVAPAPPPSAPPLPFRYLGRMTRADRHIVYLLKGDEMIPAEAGQTLDAAYRVESISAASMEFVYLPLGTRQSLGLPETP